MLVRFARRAEELGFHSLWAVDHLLRITPNPTYAGLAWLDPLLSLSHVSSHTTLPLGVIYCGCLRHPVISAKEISTLMYLAADRLILVPVLGWYGREHEVAGFPRRERGPRTDEWLDILRLLLTQHDVSYDGKFHSFENVTIDPVPGALPRIWVTGGAAYYEPDAKQDRASIKPPVIDRILRYDGWCVSAQSSPKKARADWECIARAARERGRDPNELYISQPNFVHLVETSDRDRAHEVQRPLWNSRRTLDDTFEHLSETIYLTGTIDDIIEKLKLRREAFGLQEYLALAHPTGEEEGQLELWGKHLLPAMAEF